MSIQISISNAIGSRYRGSVVPPIDPDAQAFITAASITDPTQQSAINQLVVDLKVYGVWTKMKALYPFCGSTASQHKWNLKDPRDLDAAFRLVFSGGWTHSANGALPNGTNAIADTKLNASSNLSQNSTHISFYSRTLSGSNLVPTMASSGYGVTGGTRLSLNFAGQTYFGVNSLYQDGVSNTNTRGFFIANRTASATHSLMIRGTRTDISQASDGVVNQTFRIGGSPAGHYDNKEAAFASIGDGLTSQNMTDLTTAVQTYQTTLGRSIGTQTVSDADAQAFVTNAGIVDQVEANAVNNLVIGLKADSLWTKMNALYPFVGGTATTHKFNLKDPRDLDAAFRLVFNGGWTHSANGATPNGTNAYADSKFVPSTHLGVNSNSLGYYSGTNLSETSPDPTNMGAFISVTQAMVLVKTNTTLSGRLNGSIISYSTATMRGFFSASRQSSTLTDIYLNGSQVGTGNSGGTLPNNNVLLGTISIDPSSNPYGAGFVKNDFRFAYLSDGLDDTQMANLYTAVQTFQTTLNRNV